MTDSENVMVVSLIVEHDWVWHGHLDKDFARARVFYQGYCAVLDTSITTR
jgi:hypothetical protein